MDDGHPLTAPGLFPELGFQFNLHLAGAYSDDPESCLAMAGKMSRYLGRYVRQSPATSGRIINSGGILWQTLSRSIRFAAEVLLNGYTQPYIRPDA